MNTAIPAIMTLAGTMLSAFAALIGAILGAAIAGFISWKLARRQLRQDLQLAALDRRLEAHQQAYALWHKLFFALHDGNQIGAITLECQEWWITHCLYLTPKSREAFRMSYSLAHWFHKIPYGKEENTIRKDNFNKIQSAGEIIASELGLPGIEARSDTE